MPLDLSKAIKLRKVDLAFGHYDRVGVVQTLDSITSEHQDFERVSVHFPCYCNVPTKACGTTQPGEVGAALARLDKLRPNCVKAVWDTDRHPSSSPQAAVKTQLEKLMPDMAQKVEIKFDFEKEGRHQYSVVFNL